tara:strand:+ start:246 stop:533 length:288 start_codon:yes stop_codon:yes gene_type:complete
MDKQLSATDKQLSKQLSATFATDKVKPTDKEYNKQYYLKHREKLLACSKEWNKLNRKPISNLKIKKQRINLILKRNEEKINYFRDLYNKYNVVNI